jgi:hypothetical protein
VVERSERYASEAKPEEPKDSKRRARAGLLGAGFPGVYEPSPKPRMARAIHLSSTKKVKYIISSFFPYPTSCNISLLI